ncbi:VOC family protein [Paenibacillus sp. NPDC056579]|uniref:VOC family protein n=1 Tax=unclassified Paenibacillus TaxID=185978 RepID=UPI001EF7A602|nr:VOC family protein [Paenibacillus sp. H1-7]
MPVVTLGGVFIQVTNLEQSIKYYTEVLGFRARGIEDWGNGERGATLFFDEPQGKPLVTLAEAARVPAAERPLFNLQCTDIEAMHKQMREAGHPVSELVQWDSEWNRHLHFDLHDPDGNPINLIQVQRKQK